MTCFAAPAAAAMVEDWDEVGSEVCRYEIDLFAGVSLDLENEY